MASIVPQPAAAVAKPFQLPSKLPPQTRSKNICRIRLIGPDGEAAGYLSRKQATKEYEGCYLVTGDPREALRVHIRSAGLANRPEGLMLGLVDSEAGSWLATFELTEGAVVGGVLVTVKVPEPVTTASQSSCKTSYKLHPTATTAAFACRSGLFLNPGNWMHWTSEGPSSWLAILRQGSEFCTFGLTKYGVKNRIKASS